jgi:predicted nuclease of predicted toxin-antitoxin system
MKFLADENVDAGVVAYLRACGHDVAYAAETPARTNDALLLETAARERRTLIPFDRDFGELVFLRKIKTHGVIYIRSRDESLEAKIAVLSSVLDKAMKERIPLKEFFIVATEDKIRKRRR